MYVVVIVVSCYMSLYFVFVISEVDMNDQET